MTNVVSANRLSDGTVVYVGPDGGWVDSLAAAVLLEDTDAIETALVTARADEARNLVVETLVVPVASDGASRRPASLRDRIRAAGPTVHYGAA